MFFNQAKEYLSQKKVDFQDRDIMRDPAALEELKKLGYMTTPVMQINGEVIVGFDQEKTDAALTGTK
jgi:glutaredoxin 3